MASVDEVQFQSQLQLSPAPYTPRSRPASPGLIAKRRRSLNGDWRRRRSRSLAVWIGVVGFFVTVNWWMFLRLQDSSRRSAPEISIKVAVDANASSEDVLQGDWSNYEKGRRPHRLMYTRLLALAAHALAEICNAVAISRLLNSTLVLPKFLHSNVWKDESSATYIRRSILSVYWELIFGLLRSFLWNSDR